MQCAHGAQQHEVCGVEILQGGYCRFKPYLPKQYRGVSVGRVIEFWREMEYQISGNQQVMECQLGQLKCFL